MSDWKRSILVEPDVSDEAATVASVAALKGAVPRLRHFLLVTIIEQD